MVVAVSVVVVVAVINLKEGKPVKKKKVKSVINLREGNPVQKKKVSPVSTALATATCADEFNGKRFEVLYDSANETARILAEDGGELPTLMAFWFAWYAFHPDSVIYSVE